jgi:hypothetical protein
MDKNATEGENWQLLEFLTEPTIRNMDILEVVPSAQIIRPGDPYIYLHLKLILSHTNL